METKIAELEPHQHRFVTQSQRRRNTLWGSALAFSGLQLAMVSRLTFFDFDWDLMEPVSYFIGQATSLAFFTYMFKYGVEHSYDRADRKLFDATLHAAIAKEAAAVNRTSSSSSDRASPSGTGEGGPLTTMIQLQARKLALEDSISRKAAWCGGRQRL